MLYCYIWDSDPKQPLTNYRLGGLPLGTCLSKVARISLNPPENFIDLKLEWTLCQCVTFCSKKNQSKLK